VPIVVVVGAFRAHREFTLGGRCAECTNVVANKLERVGDWGWEDESIVSAGERAGASLAFDGTKVWIVGTTDEDYGEMKVFVDEFLVKTISCQSPVRRVRQILFVSEDLADCGHVIRVESASATPISIYNLFLLQTGDVRTIGGKHLVRNLPFWSELVALENGAVLGLQKRTNVTIVDVSERVEGIVREMPMSEKWEDSMKWTVPIVCCIVIGGVVWFVFNRIAVATSDECTSSIHGQWIYVV
jgi:hypothetical protein